MASTGSTEADARHYNQIVGLPSMGSTSEFFFAIYNISVIVDVIFIKSISAPNRLRKHIL